MALRPRDSIVRSRNSDLADELGKPRGLFRTNVLMVVHSKFVSLYRMIRVSGFESFNHT